MEPLVGPAARPPDAALPPDVDRSIMDAALDCVITMNADGRVVDWNPAAEQTFGYRRLDVQGRELAELIVPPELRRDHREGLARHLRTGAARILGKRMELEAVRSDGSRLPVDVVIQRVRDEPPLFAGYLRDLSVLHQARAQLRLRARREEAMRELGRRALEGASTDALLTEAVELVGTELEVAMASVWELGSERDSICLLAARGWPSQQVGALRLPYDATAEGWHACRDSAPVVVADYEHESRFVPPAAAAKAGARSGVSVPIPGPTHCYGVFSVHATELRAFAEHEVLFVSSVANVLAAAIQRQRAEQQAHHDAVHDALTGLPNRVLLHDRLSVALARRTPRLGVLFCDLDRFKRINDGMGHAAGDEVLRTTAERLRVATRSWDTVARFGGDEFVIVCEGIASRRDALQLAERVVAALEPPITVDGEQLKVSGSVGVALALGRDVDADELIREADAAMYWAKRRGSGSVAVFDERAPALTTPSLALEADLAAAIDGGGLWLAYQPIVALEQCAGPHERCAVPTVEALARWTHPQRGPIGPAEFIPIAEDSGLILRLGIWALREACQQALGWEGPLARSAVSVNVSARQVGDARFADRVADVLGETGLAPERLRLEITESVLIDEAPGPLEQLQRLRGSGVEVVLDDFGTGYSSLAYLKRLPIDVIKIDRAFVSGLGEDAYEEAIVRVVAEIGSSLGLDVVAEGVESAEQLERLRAIGVAQAQGYLLGRPMPPEELVEWRCSLRAAHTVG